MDYARPDAGETDKDLKTKTPKSHQIYEAKENFHVPELASCLPKAAQLRDQETHPDEYRRRQRIVRRGIGTLAGAGYGAVGGGLIGGRTGSGNGFDDRRAVVGALIGALTGGAAGFGIGTAANKVVEYTGGDQQQPRIQIVLPPSEAVAQRVEEAMKSASAQRLYAYGFMQRLARQEKCAQMSRLITAGTLALARPAGMANPGMLARLWHGMRAFGGSFAHGAGRSMMPVNRGVGRAMQGFGNRISQYQGQTMHSQLGHLMGRAAPATAAVGTGAYGLGKLTSAE